MTFLNTEVMNLFRGNEDAARAEEILANHQRLIDIQRSAMNHKDDTIVTGSMFGKEYHVNTETTDPFEVPITIETRAGKQTIGEAKIHFDKGVLHVDHATLTSDGLQMLGVKMTLTSFSGGPFPHQTPKPFMTAENEALETIDENPADMEPEEPFYEGLRVPGFGGVQKDN